MARLIAIDSHGARATIRTSSDELLSAVVPVALPLGWRPIAPRSDDRVFGLSAEGDGTYVVSSDGELISEHECLDAAVEGLRGCIFMHVLATPREVVFVHAGCVAHAGAAILLPGSSGVGKTTLVAALVRAGAVYYTDDYAPLDAHGRVHPYPLPVADFDGTVGEEPVDVAVVAQTVYREGAWDVQRCSASASVLLLLEHAVNPQRQPGFALGAVREAVAGALVVQGARGDADEAAATLLGLAERHDLPPA
jgi:hypothetical protein